MLRFHTVSLAHEYEPEFPPQCVACGAPEPDAHIAVADRAFVGWSWLVPLAHFAGKRVGRRVPACRRCVRSDTFVKWGRIAVFCGALWIAFSFVHPWVKAMEMPRTVAKLLALASVCVMVAPLFLWTMWFPRPVTLDVKSDRVDYDFAREDYAVEFAERNGASVESWRG